MSLAFRALFFSLLGSVAAQNVITTIAGIDPSFTGDGKPATSVPLGYINGVAVDPSGNVYFNDPLEHLLLRVSTNGTLYVVAGNGIAAYSGDGGPATSAAIAAFDRPDQYVGPLYGISLGGLAIDKSGNVFFADGNYLRRVATDGTISTVAGGGNASPGDGGPATAASLGIISGVTFDSAGNLYFCEGNRIRKLTPGGILSTFAGTGANGFTGDGGQATAAKLSLPLALAFDSQGNLFVADGDSITQPGRIRRISTAGVITTFAGGGNKTPAAGVLPANLNLTNAGAIAFDPSGALYVYLPVEGLLLKIASGSTTLVTSPIGAGFLDNVPASTAYVSGSRIYDNSGLAFDSSGNLYIADNHNGRLRKIDTRGTITTVAGTGTYGYGGDQGPALTAFIQGPTHMTQTPDGTLYFLDTLNLAVRAISPAGIIRTVLSQVNYPDLEGLNGIASDPSGNIYALLGRRLLQLSPNGSIQVILNQPGVVADTGDNGLAVQAAIQSAGGLSRDAAGNLYLSDPNSNRIRKITPDGKIQTIAGTGRSAVSPDGAVAVSSPLAEPTTVLADSVGGVYFEESPQDQIGAAIIRYITPDGHLKTIAGTGTGGYTGDGGPASRATFRLQKRTGLLLNKSGTLYIADGFNNVVRSVAPDGIVNTVAGNGIDANAGDGGPALAASIYTPRGLLFNAKGDLLISDVSANRIRAILASAPALNVAPLQLSFTAKAGAAQTPPQRMLLTGAVTGLPFQITKSGGADWLVPGTLGGTVPRFINVRADPSNLAAGTYQGTLTITSLLAAQPTTTVAVTFQVLPADTPNLAADKTSLSYTFPSNPTDTKTDLIHLTNTGSGKVNFTARAQTVNGGRWLSITQASGAVTPQAPFDLMVVANPAGLAAGTYSGSVTITDTASGTPINVPATLTISTLDQAIRLSQLAISFTAVAGGGVVPPQNFTITNIGRGTANFTITPQTLSGGSWLTAGPRSGSATAGGPSPAVSVSASPGSLSPGVYYGFVRVDATGSANTPQIVTVVMRVFTEAESPGPSVVPSEVLFKTIQGATSPGSRNLQVYNISGTPNTFLANAEQIDPQDQVVASPANATLNPAQPLRLVLQPITTSLAPGVYDTDLTLEFSGGNVRRVGIRIIVAPAPPASKSVSSLKAEDASGCSPTQLVPAVTTLGQNFGVPASWPVPVEADVSDNCGNPLTTGSVKVTFSNGDPPVTLQPQQNGIWSGTWSSGASAGPVTLTLTAADPNRSLLGTRDVTGGLGSSASPPVLGSAVNAASNALSVPLAPRSIISLYGTNLANGTAQVQSLPVPTLMAGATVLMAGQPLPLVYASGGQVNAVVPAGININTSQQIVVQRDNTLSVPIRVDVGPAAPAIFPYPAPGEPATQGAIVNAVTYAVADPKTPVTAGNVLGIFATGLGVVDQNVPDAAGAPGNPLANTTTSPTVTVGGLPATVTFSGLSPGFVGLYQIDAIVPPGVTPGNQVPVVLSIAGQTGPASTIAVK
jgi:uncharacterized protein (TIGR03437 family)